jgi:large subunit ribosomal protein L4
MELSIKNLDNAEVGTIDLADEVFGLPVRADILARVVNWQLAKRRAGTHKAKERHEIARTGGKMYRQKGTSQLEPRRAVPRWWRRPRTTRPRPRS